MADENIVFATVGSTSFDRLVETLTSKPVLNVLERLGYTKLVVQIGRGKYEPECFEKKSFALEFYRYKDSLKDDMSRASLIISHAGAGCITESLELCKPLIVVVNEKLMDNHQFELARQLAKDEHLVYCICDDLKDVLEKKNLSCLKGLMPGDPKLFGNFLDDFMGVKSVK
ncbi:UDP-N-acetylglucosamine transferase subunit ALG13 homolog [Dendronephthya gigantea]|uniref:UDP-N-acetylglucosamine transferase subunit ALG13 homolog n=1 Tax=Dendronephthya gigantea TaxID=151771 RepID=UPI0010697FE8|nr:UDP-N-acetylglucosamine transferase subunit ALG13 homolog [Dendronephthya gigantea]